MYVFLCGVYIKTSGDIRVGKTNTWKFSVDRNSLNSCEVVDKLLTNILLKLRREV